MKLVGPTLLLLFLCQSISASPDVAIERYMAALAVSDYEAAALELAYPEYPSEEALQQRQQYVTGVIARYHEVIGTLESSPADGKIEGNKTALTIGGGDEEFTMMNPPTDFRRVSANFSAAGFVSITFMLAKQDGQHRIMYLQYEYGEL